MAAAGENWGMGALGVIGIVGGIGTVDGAEAMNDDLALSGNTVGRDAGDFFTRKAVKRCCISTRSLQDSGTINGVPLRERSKARHRSFKALVSRRV